MSQIFKKSIPNNILFDLLDTICVKTNIHYLFNLDSYKKGVYNDNFQLFIDSCKPYYHLSKQFYLNKKISYNAITTILRQICKFNKIKFTTKIKYDKSTYDICYYIFYNSEINDDNI
jgi:hypothetical protein